MSLDNSSNDGRVLTNAIMRPFQLDFQTYTDSTRPTPASTARVLIYNTTGNTIEYWNGSTWVASGASGATTLAALTDTAIAGLADADLLLYDGSNSWDNKALSGDATITNAGVISVSDLTIASEAQGDILIFDGSNWVRLAAGTSGQYLQTQGAAADPVWAGVTASVANGLNSPFTFEGGTYDPVTTVIAQTASAAALGIPDLAGVAQDWVFTVEAQTLQNKTLTTPIIVTTGSITDAGGDPYLAFVESATPTDSIQITQGDTGVGAELASVTTDTNADLLLVAAGSGVVKADGVEVVTLSGTQTLTAKTLTTPVIASMLYSGGGNAITFQDAVHTVIGRDTTDTLTNKTLDADGTGNVITNINVDELDAGTIPAADSNNVTIVDGLIMAKVSNNATNFNIFSSNAPYAFIIIDAWSINLSADTGTWKLNNGAAGAGTDITNVVTVAASDTDIDRATSIDDAAFAIAASGSLSIVFDGAGAMDAYIFIRIARLA